MSKIEVSRHTTNQYLVGENDDGAVEILARCAREDIAQKIKALLEQAEPEPTEFTKARTELQQALKEDSKKNIVAARERSEVKISEPGPPV